MPRARGVRQAAGVAVEVQRSTARAACGSPSCSPSWPSRPTNCACCAACTPTCRPIRRRSCRCTPASSSSNGRRWGPGPSTAWAPRTRTCPASSPSARRCRTAARPTTAAPSCRPSTRARRSARLRRRSGGGGPAARRRRRRQQHQATRSQSADAQRMQLDFIQSLNRDDARARAAQPGRRGGHRVVRAGLPHAEGAAEGDGPVQRIGGDQGALRHRRTGDRRASAGSACWRGASSRPACASSRSRRASGTTTAT